MTTGPATDDRKDWVHTFFLYLPLNLQTSVKYLIVPLTPFAEIYRRLPLHQCPVNLIFESLENALKPRVRPPKTIKKFLVTTFASNCGSGWVLTVTPVVTTTDLLPPFLQCNYTLPHVVYFNAYISYTKPMSVTVKCCHPETQTSKQQYPAREATDKAVRFCWK